MKKLLLASAVLFVSVHAAAQGGDDIARADARALFNQGVTLVDKGQYEQARLKFVQAYAVIQKPALLYNLAVTEQKTHRTPSAAAHFRKLLKDPTTPPDLRARAEKQMAELEPTLGRIAVDAPAGADVSVDGAVVGRAPLDGPIDVLPGRHDVSVRLGDKHLEVTRDAAPGREERVELKFDVPPPVRQPPPQVSQPAPAGRTAMTVASIAAFSLAAVGAGVAIGTGIAASGRSADGDALQRALFASYGSTACVSGSDPRCGMLLSARSDAQTLTGAAVGAGIAAGVLAAGGVVLWLIRPSNRTHVGVGVGRVDFTWTF